MVNGNAILKSLEEQMHQAKSNFEAINVEIEQTANHYNQAITNLETEGKEALKKLVNRREQLRGEYTAIYNIYQQYTVQNNNENNSTDVNKEESKNENTEAKESKSTVKSKSTKGKNNLTTAEVDKLKKELAKKQEDDKLKDVPDYLQDSYK